MTEKVYVIGGIEFTQPPLVLGQLQQLLAVMEGVAIPRAGSALAIVAGMGEKLQEALAVVLVADGEAPEGRDLVERAGWLRDHVDLVTAAEVVEDFFGCNRISLLLAIVARIREKIELPKPTPLPTSAAPSPQETSPSGDGSCGT